MNKLFTPKSATQTLPLVKRITADILNAGAILKALVENHGHEAQERDDFIEQSNRLQDLYVEMEALGCYFKDWNFEIGLVDFPAKIDGRDVLLCWRSDEEKLEFYHGYEEGYAGRRPIPVELIES